MSFQISKGAADTHDVLLDDSHSLTRKLEELRFQIVALDVHRLRVEQPVQLLPFGV